MAEGPDPATLGGMDVLVETRGLTKRYGKTLAVDDVGMSVRAGEVYGFLGPNGAGKTTTLRMMLGLVRPTSGVVEVAGKAPGQPGHLDGVGSLVEGPAFYPYLSGRRNLQVLARHAGVAAGRVDTVLELVDMTDRADRRFAAYSLGMRQRLGLAAALLKEPRLLILDEPTNGLDPAGMADMRRLIRRFSAEGVTVLLSSHLLGEVQQICDRVGVLSGGRLLVETSVSRLRGVGTLEVQAEPVRAALDVARGLVGDRSVAYDGTRLRLDVRPGDAARVNAALVTAGIAVRELHWREPELEDVFLELTGGGAK
ncbi:Bacitracin transport ATP-binding protein BcrA [Streptomyces sp. enrichment culture]